MPAYSTDYGFTGTIKSTPSPAKSSTTMAAASVAGSVKTNTNSTAASAANNVARSSTTMAANSLGKNSTPANSVNRNSTAQNLGNTSSSTLSRAYRDYLNPQAGMAPTTSSTGKGNFNPPSGIADSISRSIGLTKPLTFEQATSGQAARVDYSNIFGINDLTQQSITDIVTRGPMVSANGPVNKLSNVPNTPMQTVPQKGNIGGFNTIMEKTNYLNPAQGQPYRWGTVTPPSGGTTVIKKSSSIGLDSLFPTKELLSTYPDKSFHLGPSDVRLNKSSPEYSAQRFNLDLAELGRPQIGGTENVKWKTATHPLVDTVAEAAKNRGIVAPAPRKVAPNVSVPKGYSKNNWAKFSAFEKAYALAKSKGLSTFTYRGKSYTTK